MLGFCTSPEFVDHLTGEHHPERPDRIRAIALAVRQAGLVDSPNPFPDFSPGFQLEPLGGEKMLEISPVPADEQTIALVHSRQHIERIKQACQSGGGMLDEGDTPVSQRSFELALLSSGAVLSCCDAVMDGRVRRAFAAVRPPGHHAEPDRAMGFCLFGNVAVAARYLQRRHAVHTVAIVDFDVHHGNGTQAAFEDDPSVLFISIHQHPKTCYPGTGYEWEVGEGPGRGATLNVPMDPGAGDERYVAEFQSKILPKLDHFKPEILLISAGFDAHREDDLGQLGLNENDFAWITGRVHDVAKRHARGRIVSMLEGGYNLDALARSVEAHIRVLADL